MQLTNSATVPLSVYHRAKAGRSASISPVELMTYCERHHQNRISSVDGSNGLINVIYCMPDGGSVLIHGIRADNEEIIPTAWDVQKPKTKLLDKITDVLNIFHRKESR